MGVVERIKRAAHVDPYANFASERTTERLGKLLSPRWIANKVALSLYERRHPDHPWITQRAIEVFDALLRPRHAGLEWGSGNGTPWIARRSRSLVSIEHDAEWHENVRGRLAAERITNVDYRLVPEGRYLAVLDELEAESLDFVVVDGLFRDKTFLRSVPKLKPDGFIVFDNVNWFLPSESDTPHSRAIGDGPATLDFAKIARMTAPWKVLWTTNGVNDTAIFIKPS